jgi:peptidoglycan/LPS O-acetylase OafA/YrhL
VNASAVIQEPAAGEHVAPRTYNNSIGYLRGFVVALVAAHHAALAYHSYAPPPPASLDAPARWWQAFPIVDAHHSVAATILVGFNDIFFMSLMFFLSGLFVWNGLKRKGAAAFLRGRARRLGLPFIAAAAIVAPLAYYATFLQIGAPGGVGGFVRQWLSLGNWPAGPAWFVWVLLAFDCVAALLFALAPRWGERLGRFTAATSRQPALLFALLIAVSAALYAPLALIFTPIAWAAFGPLAFQTSRILHYLAYFVIGAGVGACGLERGVLAAGGKLARRWPLWIVAAIVAFLIESAVTVAAFTTHLQSQAWAAAGDLLFGVSCAASSMAFLALFIRFASGRSRVFDSLTRNSYAIYLLHYAFVSWLQYALLPAAMPGLAKFAMVFAGALALSWATASAIRRIPAVARIVQRGAYSMRSALIGSTRAARREGSHAASIATLSNSTTAEAMATGSYAVTPNSIARSQ